MFVSDEEIITTPTHPFYSPIKGWTAASTLRSGDILVLINGEEVIIEDVQHEILESPISVYNFAVEDFHTYYIGCSKILVHNMCQRALTVDEFISNLEDTTRKNGAQTRNLVSSGGYDQALKKTGDGSKPLKKSG